MKKVVITGPESTGKSTLSAFLAEHYNTVWVPEYAREYIENLARPYEERDLPEIARQQLALENRMAGQAGKLLICDTDLIVIKIWAEHKYGRCPDEIIQSIISAKYDLHLLTYIDLPWEDDPQRENPHLRQHFYDIFKRELEAMDIKYVEIKGSRVEREKSAIRAIDNVLINT